MILLNTPITLTINPNSLKSTPFKSPHKKPSFKPLCSSNFHSGISSNMWWADLKATIGQRFNFEGVISTVKVLPKDHNLALPHLTVQDIRSINWFELKKRGFNGVVFDKDNTLTYPYVLALWGPLKPSLDRCKSVFGEDNVGVFSNTVGLYEFDPDGSKARELERQIGVKIIRHKVKKPGGDANEIEKHFGCLSKTLVMVGDRYLTDVVYGNRNGFLTVLTKPLCLEKESFVVKQVRKLENGVVNWWLNKGLKPNDHCLLSGGCAGLVNDSQDT